MTSRNSTALIALVLILTSVTGYLAYRNQRLARIAANAETKAKKFDDRCRALTTAMSAELALATGSDAKEAEAQGNQLFEDLTSPAIGFAACSAVAVDQARLAVCWANHDYGCVREIARKSLPQ